GTGGRVGARDHDFQRRGLRAALLARLHHLGLGALSARSGRGRLDLRSRPRHRLHRRVALWRRSPGSGPVPRGPGDPPLPHGVGSESRDHMGEHRGAAARDVHRPRGAGAAPARVTRELRPSLADCVELASVGRDHLHRRRVHADPSRPADRHRAAVAHATTTRELVAAAPGLAALHASSPPKGASFMITERGRALAVRPRLSNLRVPNLSEIDMGALRRGRLARLQAMMKHYDLPVCLFYSTANIRYATGVDVMGVWTAGTFARYCIVPAEGRPVLFEYKGSVHVAQKLVQDVRPAFTWQFGGTESAGKARAWAQSIRA